MKHLNFILPTILIGAINAVSQQNRWQTGGKSLKIASATAIENTIPIVDAGSGTRELCKCQGLILYRWWPDVFLVKGYAA